MATSSSATSRSASAPRNATGPRLRQILEDSGYVDEDDQLDLDYAACVITRRSGRTFTASRLRTILFKEGVVALEEGATIADGLGIDLRELAYDEGEVPKARRSRTGNPLEDLEVL